MLTCTDVGKPYGFQATCSTCSQGSNLKSIINSYSSVRQREYRLFIDYLCIKCCEVWIIKTAADQTAESLFSNTPLPSFDILLPQLDAFHCCN